MLDLSPLTGPVPTRKKPKQDMGLMRLTYERATRGMQATRQWAKTAVKCVEYVEGNQWDERAKAALDRAELPHKTFNRISPLVRLVTGYQQQNRYDIRYEAGTDALSTQDVADTLTHTAKQITTQNKLKWRESDVFRDGIVGGRGYFDARLDFTKNDLGDVRITALDPFSVHPDPEAEDYEPEKWGHVITSRWMSLDEIKLVYGSGGEKMLEPYGLGGVNMPALPVGGPVEDDERPESFFALARFFDGLSGGISIGETQFGMLDFIDRTRKTIRVLDMQHYVLDKVRYLVNAQTGERRPIPEAWDRDRIAQVLEWAASPVDTNGQPKETYDVFVRQQLERRVRWTTVAGDIVLYDEWSPYRTFTVIPYFAYFRRGKTMGMVEDLLDPQDDLNKRRNARLAIAGTSANSGWMYHEAALDVEQEETLRNEGSAPGVHIKWSGEQWMRPQRIEPPTPPMNQERLEKDDAADLKEISGINESALGSIDRVQSGRAIEARQRQAVIAIQTYVDNMARTRELLGEKILELVQDFYSEERLIRATGDDGQPADVVINQQAADGQIVNDVTVGTYNVAVDEAPMSATYLAGQFEEALALRQQGIPVPDDIIVDLSSMPRKRDIKQRIAQAQQQAGQQQNPEIQKATIQASATVEAARIKAGFDFDLGQMELAIKREQGAFIPQPPMPPGGGGGGGGAPGPAPSTPIPPHHPAAAAAGHRPGAPGHGAGAPAAMPGGPAPHQFIPGGGVRPQGAGIAPELPPFAPGAQPAG